MSPEIFAWESVADQTDHFADAFVPDCVRRFDGQKFTAHAILFKEIQIKKMVILMF